MSNDSAEPRVGAIAMVGIASIVTLVIVRAGLVSYFDQRVREEEYTKIGSLKPEALTTMRADEKQRLSSGSMPIDKSMQMLAAKGRMGAGPDVLPTPSKDVAPLQGWIQMPSEVPAPMMAPEPSAAAAAPSGAPASPAAPSTSAAPAASSARPAPAPAPAGSQTPRQP